MRFPGVELCDARFDFGYVELKLHLGQNLRTIKECVKNKDIPEELFSHHIFEEMIVDGCETSGYVLCKGRSSVNSISHLLQPGRRNLQGADGELLLLDLRSACMHDVLEQPHSYGFFKCSPSDWRIDHMVEEQVQANREPFQAFLVLDVFL